MEDTLKLIKKTIKKIRPYINSDGGDLEFVKFEDGIVYVRLLGACAGCSMIDITLKDGIEAARGDVIAKTRVEQVRLITIYTRLLSMWAKIGR